MNKFIISLIFIFTNVISIPTVFANLLETEEEFTDAIYSIQSLLKSIKYIDGEGEQYINDVLRIFKHMPEMPELVILRDRYIRKGGNDYRLIGAANLFIDGSVFDDIYKYDYSSNFAKEDCYNSAINHYEDIKSENPNFNIHPDNINYISAYKNFEKSFYRIIIEALESLATVVNETLTSFLEHSKALTEKEAQEIIFTIFQSQKINYGDDFIKEIIEECNRVILGAYKKEIDERVRKKEEAEKIKNVKIVQKLLNKLGYSSGDIDGAQGKNTINAIKKFQSNNNLKVDGIIMAKLITHMENKFLLLEEWGKRREEERKKIETEIITRKKLSEEAETIRNEYADKELVNQYATYIQNKVSNYFNRVGLPENLKSKLRVKLLPNGEVIDVSVAASSGHDIFDRRAVNAVQKASPLPVPEDLATFERLDMRDITFTFRP